MARRTFARFLVAGLLAATLAGPGLAQQPNPVPTIPVAEEPPGLLRIDPFEGFVLDSVDAAANVAQAVGPCVARSWTWITTGEEPALPPAPMPRLKDQQRVFSFSIGLFCGDVPGRGVVCQTFGVQLPASPPAIPPVRSTQTLSRVAVSPAPVCANAPSDQAILRALGPVPCGVPYVFETHRDNVVIVKNCLVNKIDAPRMYPLVGQAQLHHCQWECPVYYTETIQSSYPFPCKVQKQRVQVVYLDKDNLNLCAGQEPCVPMAQVTRPAPVPTFDCPVVSAFRMTPLSAPAQSRTSVAFSYQVAGTTTANRGFKGTWFREAPGTVTAIAFMGDNLTLTQTVNDGGTVATLTITASCSVTPEGMVHGVVTGTDVTLNSGNDPDGMELASLSLKLQGIVDQPFAFRCRSINGGLMLSNLKLGCWREACEDWNPDEVLLPGIYTANTGQLPTPKALKPREVRAVSGMALPSGQYLQHHPQFVPDGPPCSRPAMTVRGDGVNAIQRIGVDFDNLEALLPPPSRVPNPCAVPPCPTMPPVFYGLPGVQCPYPPPGLVIAPGSQYLAPVQPYGAQAWAPSPPPACPGPVCPTVYAPPPTMPQPLPQSNIGNGSSPNPSRTVTLKDVVELAQLGVSDEIIVNQMRNTNSKYALTVADIKYLKMCGVSDRVIIEMQGVPQVRPATSAYTPSPAYTPTPVQFSGPPPYNY